MHEQSAPYLARDEWDTVADVLDDEVDRISDDEDLIHRQIRLESITERIRNVPADPRLGAVLKRYEVHRLLKAIEIAAPQMNAPAESLDEIRAKLEALAELRASFDRERRNDDPGNWHVDDRQEPRYP
jgi:hypothetical protein